MYCTYYGFLKINLFIYLFIFGCIGSSLLRVGFSSCGEQGLLFVAVRGLLIAVPSGWEEWALGARASVVVACGLGSCGSQALECKLSSVVRGLSSFPAACGIFPDQGSNLCPLHWQADS